MTVNEKNKSKESSQFSIEFYESTDNFYAFREARGKEQNLGNNLLKVNKTKLRLFEQI